MLDGAKLQGANLDGAELQGATLDGVELQGANLDGAKLQGATLVGAQLQGAMLDYAQLQSSKLLFAELQGARLVGAQLQSATLVGAQLQGARLDFAKMQGADLLEAYVWRTVFTDASTTDVATKRINWKPVSITGTGPAPWTKATYEELRGALAKIIPEGAARTAALKQIESLDCTETRGKSDCVEEASHPQFASVTQDAYEAKLAELLKGLVCDGDNNAIHILRGLMNSTYFDVQMYFSTRLGVTAANAPKLIDDILKPKTPSDCPVSADLTAADKDQLLKIKHAAEKDFPPKTAPAKAAKGK